MERRGVLQDLATGAPDWYLIKHQINPTLYISGISDGRHYGSAR